ncbi:MAG TPA: hypothetical protein VJ983_02805 [candidate division Zixibacteria bacterium]|nr:hypothetical protein [candidate division Zixibacteria bacterium]
MSTMYRYFILSFMLVVLFAGCSGKKDETPGANSQDEVASANPNQPLTVKDTIETMMNAAMDHLRYGDKSALYENEFPYVRDENTFDQYLKLGPISYASTDSLTHIDVDSLTMYAHDSALTHLTVHFEGPSGKKSELKDSVVVYYSDGRWIKPTVGASSMQANYDRIIRAADSAAAAEAQGE